MTSIRTVLCVNVNNFILIVEYIVTQLIRLREPFIKNYIKITMKYFVIE